jgi:hypothetical protein
MVDIGIVGFIINLIVGLFGAAIEVARTDDPIFKLIGIIIIGLTVAIIGGIVGLITFYIKRLIKKGE